MPERKGILLAGGRGTRLYPATVGVDRHLWPVWDRPLIYYPLTALLRCGVREVLVVTGEHQAPAFRTLLGQGARWGMRFAYETQPEALGSAHALELAEDWLHESPCVLAHADNLFLGEGFDQQLRGLAASSAAATLLTARVDDPQRYGVVRMGPQGRPIELLEKPSQRVSPWAVTGLSFFDGTAAARVRELSPAAGGERHLLDLHRAYLSEGKLAVAPLQPGVRWWDCGRFETLQDAGDAVRRAEFESGRKLPGPEAAARQEGLLDDETWQALLERLPEGPYRRSLELLAATPPPRKLNVA